MPNADLDLTPYAIDGLPAALTDAFGQRRIYYGTLLEPTDTALYEPRRFRERFDAHIVAWAGDDKSHLLAVAQIRKILGIPTANCLCLNELGLDSLPDQLGVMAELRKRCGAEAIALIHVRGNQLVTLPESISLFTTLKYIDAIHNRITSLPDALGELVELVSFKCENNRLTCLPPFLSRMPKLREVRLDNNLIEVVDESIGILPALVRLQLSGNPLRTFAPPGGALPSLEFLDLTNSKLREFGPGALAMPKLITLHARRAMLERLPEAFGQLVNLRHVRLGKNQLTTLPDSIGNLTKLEWITLTNNPVITLPRTIDSLPRSCKIFVSGAHFDSGTEQMLDLIGDTGPEIHLYSRSDLKHRRTEDGLFDELLKWAPSLVDNKHGPALEKLTATPGWRNFTAFLQRLEDTADAKQVDLRAQLEGRITTVVSGILNAPALQKTVFEYAGEALGACGDRIAYGLQPIEFIVLDYHAHTAQMCGLQVIALAKRMFRQGELQRIVYKRAEMAGLSMNEIVETHLAFQMKLSAEGVQIATPVSAMNHLGVSGIRDEWIQAAREELAALENGPEMKAFLRTYLPLQMYVERHNKAVFDAIDKAFEAEGLSLAVPDDDITDGEYMMRTSDFSARVEAARNETRNSLIDALDRDSQQ